YHHFAQLTGRALPTTTPRVRYIQTTMSASLRRMERLADRGDIDMFCLNDGGAAEVPEDVRVRTISDLLERMFPVRAPWERAVVSESPAAAPSAARSAVRR
ncbi:MAG: sugar phosphotransferase, partial [Actinobacteria bacterium]|nr:sugar phosphotransferase [Actinomycetota bacterium]